jgi:hypothetical protein
VLLRRYDQDHKLDFPSLKSAPKEQILPHTPLFKMVNSPTKNHRACGGRNRQNGGPISYALDSPAKRPANDMSNIPHHDDGDGRCFGFIQQGSKRNIRDVGSNYYAGYGIRRLPPDDEVTSSTTSGYSSRSLETYNPAVQQLEHSLRPASPPPTLSPDSMDCEESNSDGNWTCVACTFVNTNPNFLSCEVCAQSRTTEPAETFRLKGRLTPANRDKYAAQQTCLQVQKEKIEQVEERAILDERMKEIIEMQQQLLAEIEEEKNSNGAPSPLSRSNSARHLQETQTRIDGLQDDLLRERSDQVHVELQLRVSQRNLFQQQEQNTRTSSHDIKEYLDQERMLRSWKYQWDERHESLNQIAEFQKQLEDTFAQAFAC